MPGVAETFKTVIHEMTYGTDFQFINLLHSKNANLTHEDLNTSIDEPEHRWNIHLVPYDTLTSRMKPSSNGRLSHCSWNFGIFDESHRYKKINCAGWRIAMNVKIGFNLQVTAIPGFHSLYDWCYPTMWLFWGASEDPEDETDGNSQRRCTVCRSEELDVCHPNWRQWRSTGCSTPGNPNSKALDNEEVVRIKTHKWETNCSDTEGESTPCWSRMEWGQVS